LAEQGRLEDVPLGLLMRRDKYIILTAAEDAARRKR